MKLRNKKTGEIVEYDEEVIYYRKLTSNGHEDWTPYHPEDWEDYEPAEPLIKDEKIRKAVRAWAEACGANKVAIANNYCLTTEEDIDVEIVFTLPIFEGIDHDDFYAITELCGEEKE